MLQPLWHLDRREMFRHLGLGLMGSTCASWLPALAEQVAADPRRKRHCILLWMSGGPTQTDTFDMKPGHNNGGEFKEVATRTPGLRFSEHLPTLAEHAERMAVIRSLTTKEGDHERGTYLVRTGQPPMGAVAYPSIACSLAKALGATAESALPNYVSVAPTQQISPAAFGPGFLGASYSPALVGGAGAAPGVLPGVVSPKFAALKLDDLELPSGVGEAQAMRRMKLWNAMEQRFLDDHSAASFIAHNALYRKAADMMRPEVRAAFDLSQEEDSVREKYGPGMFGQGCLLARRLVERGVPFVEVSLGAGLGWDTHADNFKLVKKLSEELDAGWGTLMTELSERRLLDDTTIVWMGEFGRTPVINAMGGRDHFPNAWSCVLAGGGIKGGQAYGRTSDDGMKVEEKPVAIGDVLATLCAALGVPPDAENLAMGERPIKIAEGTPIADLLA
ncbi:DUF1501 domain-containing protein [Lacipirellula limnantheis]|uniref:DUF1501 domain-containing protein n=1 Tax=Lacipirellula limnantheis TaxID=2528024 RepID=A0A517U0P8_9BACT|nr:DUF1501 domain-containing protein [Lacipirellula limnantheis]QDT74183.1 hypothetical protein I41_33780 [Lacipirellula limnantheis]